MYCIQPLRMSFAADCNPPRTNKRKIVVALGWSKEDCSHDRVIYNNLNAVSSSERWQWASAIIRADIVAGVLVRMWTLLSPSRLGYLRIMEILRTTIEFGPAVNTACCSDSFPIFVDARYLRFLAYPPGNFPWSQHKSRTSMALALKKA